MASEIRVNSLTNRSGLSTVSITDAGLNAVGIITAHNFKTGTTNVHSTGVTAADGVFTGNVSVTGNLNVSGVLTYEDVTNIDSVGVVTARTDINLGDSIIHIGDTNTKIRFPADDTITAETGGSEALRIDSSQRLLVGNTSAETSFRTPKVQIKGSDNNTGLLIHNTNSNADGASIIFAHSRGTGTVNSGDLLGDLVWCANDGTDIQTRAAYIRAAVDGAPGSNDMPGRIQFYTTADGSSSPTERLRITSAGKIGIGVGSPAEMMEITNTGGTGSQIQLRDTSTGTGAGDGVRFGYNGSGAQIWNFEATYIRFATSNVERLRIGSGGGHKITCGEGYYAANLTECNDGRIALNINQTRSGQTKAIAIGAISDNSATGIQCYDTSNNSANNLILNPFGGNMGLGTNNPTSDGGTTFEIYDDNTPSIRLNDGGAYKALFQLRGNDLEIRGSNGQLEFYTGNADGASSSLRGAITSAGHKWTHNGSIFHGSNDVTDFTQASRDSYNNISLRAGVHNGGTTPTNTNSAIKIYPAGVRSTTTGNLTGGITWQHLDPNNSDWGSRFGSGSQIWMGASLHDTPGQERDRFNLWMNDQTSQGSQPNNLALEAYPNGIVRHPKVPSFGCIKSGHQYPVNGSRTIITPWTEHFDQGSNFNASTGVFTAPVPGKYYFYVSVMLDRNDNGDYQISIYRNGSLYYNSNDMVSNSTTTFLQTTVCGIVEMSANDTVDFRMYNSSSTSSFIYQNHYTHCGGYLIG